MKILEFIDKWNISRTMIARRIKMLVATFNNKLTPKHPTKFSIGEQAKIINVLRLLEKDIHDTIKTNWINDQDKEKICPGCGYENTTLKGNEYKCPQCSETWLAIHTNNKLL